MSAESTYKSTALMTAVKVTRQTVDRERIDADELLTDLIERYQDCLYGFIVNIVRDDDDAKDCLQETFRRAMEMITKSRSVNKQWLYRVARHRAVDVLNGRKRSRVSNLSAIEETPTRESGRSSEEDRVRAALGHLSEEDRSLLFLSYVDGMSSLEIGQIVRARAGTVRVRIHRASHRFRAIYASLKREMD